MFWCQKDNYGDFGFARMTPAGGVGEGMVSPLGLEPRTNALKGRCSTN